VYVSYVDETVCNCFGYFVNCVTFHGRSCMICFGMLFRRARVRIQVFTRTLTRHSRINYMDRCNNIGVKCVYNVHMFYTVLIYNTTIYSNPPVSQLNSPCSEFTSVWSMFPCNSNCNIEGKINNQRIVCSK